MLVLTRKLNEEIIINNDIVVKIIGINDNQIKIGIEAPRTVNILRGEIYEKVKNSILTASKQSSEKPAIVNKLKIKKLDN